MARKSRQVEVRLVAEYLKENYSKYTFITACPLGKIPEELLKEQGYKRAIGIMRPYRPEVDAVVLLPGALILVEAKVRNYIDGAAKLPWYKSLVPFTPELKDYLKLPIIMELVIDRSATNLEIMARAAGVKIVVFCPEWLEQYQKDRENYWTSDYRRVREEKLKLREYYGVE